MSNNQPLFDLFERTPEAVSVLTDGQLAQLFQETFSDPAKVQRLLAEALVRRWLYEERCPTDLADTLSKQTLSKEFLESFHTRLRPLRRCFDNSDAKYATVLEVPVEVPAEERAIWNFLRQRLFAFLTSDGLLALVPPVACEKGDGVAVPFRLNHSGKFRDLGRDLQAWSDDFSSLRDDYKLAMGADVLASFSVGNEPSGGSFGLPLILARERDWAVDVPEFAPLDVLASGEIRNGTLMDVGGVEAKQDLARRMGCAVFLCPSAEPNEAAQPLAVGLHFRELIPKIGEHLRQRTAASPVRRALQRCQLVVSSPESRLEDYSGAFRRLTELQPKLGAHEADQFAVALAKIAKQLGVPGYHTLNSEVETLLAAYRARAFHGRNPLLNGLQNFLRSPGGLRLIIGKSGYGKTALMTHLLDQLPSNRAVFRHFFSQERSPTRLLAGFYNSLGLFLAGLLRAPMAKGPFKRDDIVLYWDELRLSGVLERNKVVIILDGLDEAEEQLEPPFVEKIPAGVHVFAAMRSADTDRAESYVEKWRAFDPHPLTVDELDDATIHQWLATEGAPALRHLSINATFRDLLRQRTRGCPRFIADMLGVLARVQNLPQCWETELPRLPDDYKKFVQEQYRELKKDRDFTDSMDVFLGLLCAAEDELNDQEVRDLLGSIPKLPWRCDRWVAQSSGTEGQGARYVLQTSLLKEALREEVAWQRQQQQLVSYCERWAEHGSPYALRHYTTHLALDKKWKVVADLILDDSFRTKIAEHLADDLDLPVRLLRFAFERANHSGDWEGTALLMLAHVELNRKIFDLHNLDKGSPDQTAAFAAKVLDHADPARAALLRLIQAWTLVLDHRPLADLELLRQQFSSKRMVLLSGLEADVASGLIARVFASDDPRLADIAGRLLDEEARLELLEHLAALRTDTGFVGACRILATLPRSSPRAANLVFDRAVKCLAVALAEANHWDKSLGLINSLLPRQQSLNLVQVGRVASAQNSLPLLKNLREKMNRLVNACARDMDEFNRGKLNAWIGTPDDRSVCLGSQLQLDAWSATVEDPEGATGTWRNITNEAARLVDAGNVSLRARFNVLHGVAEAILSASRNPRFAYLSRQPTHGGDSFLLNTLRAVMNAWDVMAKNNNITSTAAAHDLVKLITLAEDAQFQLENTAPGLPEVIANRRKALWSRANKLSTGNRDELWMRIAIQSCEVPDFDVERTMIAIRNLDDRQLSSRAIGRLVRRLQTKGKWRLVPSIAEGNRSLAPSIWLAYGLAMMDAKPDKSLKQLLRSCLPERRYGSVQVAILKADLAAALRTTDPDFCRLCLGQAKGMVMNHPSIYFTLEVAEAAHKAGDKQTRDDLLAKAMQTALDAKEAAKCGFRQHRGETEQLRQSDYVRTVDMLCAVARTIFDLNLASHANLCPHLSLLTWARKIARDHVPGISTRTGALAEVAEAAAMMEQQDFANEVLDGMQRFVDKELQVRLSDDGKDRFKFERQTCLGELVLGYLKTGRDMDAVELKGRLYETGTGKSKRPIQDPITLHALARLLVIENNLGGAWPLLRQIKNPAIRAKAARDVAIELARRGRWQHVIGVAAFIERSEFKQKHLHKVIKAVIISETVKQHEKRLVCEELLWACSDTFDSAIPALAHLVRHDQGVGVPIAKALAWAESRGGRGIEGSENAPSSSDPHR